MVEQTQAALWTALFRDEHLNFGIENLLSCPSCVCVKAECSAAI